MQQKTEKARQVVILGGGYAGLMAAFRLAGKTKKANIQVTLIDAKSEFVERIRLHQAASNQRIPRRPYIDLLKGSRIGFVQGKAVQIDPQLKTIHLQGQAGEANFGLRLFDLCFRQHGRSGKCTRCG